MVNCWLKRTPFQTALLVMLITLIPFTAIIITVYVLSLHTVQLKGDCDVACANKHQRSKYPFFELKDEVNPMAPGQKETSLISYELEELTTTVIRASPYKIRSSFWNAPTEKDFFMEPGQLDTEKSKQKLEEINKHENVIHRVSDYAEEMVCPKDVSGSTDYPYVVAVVQALYIQGDTIQGLNYLCSGAIITTKWIVSSSECFNSDFNHHDIMDTLLVRAGSPFWSIEGVLHQLKQIIHPPLKDRYQQDFPTIVAMELKNSFMELPSIYPLRVPSESIFESRSEAETYSWDSENKLPFLFRKKYEPLQVKAMELHEDSECHLFKHRKSVFCGEELTMPGHCNFLTGAPIIKNTHLIGIHIASTCHNNRSTHYFTDIVYYYKWLRMTTKFHPVKLNQTKMSDF